MEGIKVFISYSHKDEDLRDELGVRLKPLERQKLIEPWHDRKISPGEEWRVKIDENLELADIILLLVSAHFMASDYCCENELKRALERHDNNVARLIPIIVSDVSWGSSLFAKLQALPKDGKAVELWRNKNSAWKNIADGIESVARELKAAKELKASCVWVVVFSGTVPDGKKLQVEAILEHLRKVSDDPTLTLRQIKNGSIILVLEGTSNGFERISSLWKSGDLRSIEGFRIESIELGLSEGVTLEKFATSLKPEIPMSQIFSQGYAVVIGVGADLPVTVTDATAIASFLYDLSRCAYQQDRVKLLTETSAHRENVLAALDWLAREANQESTVIVYFSGHGMQTPDYYLIPNGYDPENLSSTAISGKEFTEKLRAIQARKLVVLLDCCHAGGLAEAKHWVKSPLPPSIIEQLGGGGGRVVIASSRQSEISLTGDPYSVFTMAVLESLAGYGAFEYDGYARVLDLAMWVGRKVPDRTSDSQHPIIKVNNLEDNFALAWYSAGDKTIHPLQSHPDNAPLSSSGERVIIDTLTPVLPLAEGATPLLEELREEHRVPFTNRDDEMEMILSSLAPAYYILDAPAGYGKTELLMQLESRFRESGWSCCYASVDEDYTTASLANDLAGNFGITLPKHNHPYGSLLGGELRKKWLSDPKKGLVLLIDLEKRPSLSLLQDLLRSFIPDVQRCLRDLADFKRSNNRFRVIIAGRNLCAYRNEEKNRERLLPTYLKLSPFRFNVIRKSAMNYLSDDYRDSIDQLSAHLFFLTGGHPGCMAHMLEMYKNLHIATDDLIERFGVIIWREVVRKYVESIHDEISRGPKDLYKVLERVSVFRFVDVGILEELNEDLISANYDKHRLADDLTTTYLFEKNGRYLKDDITRRLLTIRLQNEAPRELIRRCDEAKDICLVRLRDQRVPRPEKWVIEYLFQSLQRYSNDIQTQQQRAAIRQTFLKEVSQVLQVFVREHDVGQGDWRDMREDLMQVIDDWEFQFTVNYYLRNDDYNQEPYEEVLRQIEQFFSSHQQTRR